MSKWLSRAGHVPPSRSTSHLQVLSYVITLNLSLHHHAPSVQSPQTDSLTGPVQEKGYTTKDRVRSSPFRHGPVADLLSDWHASRSELDPYMDWARWVARTESPFISMNAIFHIGMKEDTGNGNANPSAEANGNAHPNGANEVAAGNANPADR